MRHRTFAALAALAMTLLLAAGAALAQEAPKRPKLPGARADTNDATAYVLYGTSKLESDPWEAADALYWATRIDPTSAVAFYARWVALQVQDPGHLDHLARSNDPADRRALLAIDSLNARALMLDPFLWRYLERKRFELVAIRSVHGRDRTRMESFAWLLGRSGPFDRAMTWYSAGGFDSALKQFASVLVLNDSLRLAAAKGKRPHEDDAALDRFGGYVHLERARIFYILTRYDSAAIELRLAAAGLRASDTEEERLVRIYESHALNEYALGIVEEKLGRADSAREAYARALQEDLSFAPAHLTLAGLSLAARDTAAAIRELQLAAQLDPNDAATAFFEARALLFAGRAALAVAPFNRAVELNPYFAAPHYYLAAIYEGSGYNDEAIAEYEKYLRLAAVSDTLLPSATSRLASLRKAQSASAPSKP